MRDAFIQRLLEMAEQDPRILLVTGDLGFGVFNEFRKRIPGQFINAGVAEQNMMGLATGLALEGHIVYTYSIANFSFMRCLEQVRNDASYHGANVNVVCTGGGFSYGALGISHHATEDLAIMRAIPGITVVSPGDDWEAMEATQTLAATPGASYLRLDKSTAGMTQRAGETFALGKMRELRSGTDLTIAVTGGILEEALGAADDLVQDGIRCRVLSVHTIKPLDTEGLVKAATETGGIVTVEEHTVLGGLGSAVTEALFQAGIIPARFQSLGLKDCFSSTVGSQQYLRAHYGFDRAAIVQAVRQVLKNRPLQRATPPAVPLPYRAAA